MTTVADLVRKQSKRRCVVLGNGISLRESMPEVRRLANSGYAVLGSNRIYLDGGIIPDFLAVIDDLVEEDNRSELMAISDRTTLILDALWRRRYPEDVARNIVWAAITRPERGNLPGFWESEKPGVVHGGGTVTYVLLQLAYLMGFSSIDMFGLDHRYVMPDGDQWLAEDVLVSSGPDPNHFNQDYFGPGRRYHDPKISRMETAYRIARGMLDEAGVRVVNRTPGTALDVFEKETIYA